MAILDGDNLTEIPRAGSWGNKSAFHSKHNFTGVAQNDVINLMKIPANTKVLDLHAMFAPFGAARTIDIGFIAVDSGSSLTADPDYWTPTVIDVSGLGDLRTPAAPIIFTEDVYVTATLAGAAGANADLDTVIDYEFIG